MTRLGIMDFEQTWCVDFEFCAPNGERPMPICLVAHEIQSGKTIRLWDQELRSSPHPPYSVSKDSVFVAYYASAEFGCHLALDWPMPACVLDLFVEFRVLTN